MLKNKDGNLSSGGKIRTVFDVGCGVASFGAYLLPLDILAMSLAPNDVHQNQIQFALERGIPATLGVLGTMRLPYPSKSFDLAHCSRCRIDWTQRDGILLLEIDRLLRPGGYFAWSSPPVYRDDPEEKQMWTDMSDLVSRMCWTIASKRDQTVIWAKPVSNECYEKRPPGTQPPLCGVTSDPDSGWQEPLRTCITPVTSCKALKTLSDSQPDICCTAAGVFVHVYAHAHAHTQGLCTLERWLWLWSTTIINNNYGFFHSHLSCANGLVVVDGGVGLLNRNLYLV